MSRGAGKRDLTPEEFGALLALLHPDREAAAQAYESVRSRLVRMFEWWGCTHAEALADETFDRVARKAADGLVLERSDPYAYMAGVARHVFQEWARHRQREEGIRESAAWTSSAAPAEEPDLRIEQLRQCLGTLTAEQQSLLLRYHRDEQRIRSRKVLCAELGIPMNALRIRVHRLRKKVEACVGEKLRNRS